MGAPRKECLLADADNYTNYGGGNNPENQLGNQDRPSRPERVPWYQATERFLSVILFVFIVVLGIVLVVGSNLKLNNHSLGITPRVVNCYAAVLISMFLIWFFFNVWRNRNSKEAREEESGSLIPGHLLNGLVLFGVGSSVCQVVTVLDFVKCRRYVSKLDTSYLVYPFCEMAFMFSQIYMFYTLSKNRRRKLWFGSPFTMFTFGVNLTIWAKYFFAGAVNSPALKGKTWLSHYYYGVRDKDLCSQNITGENSRALHSFHTDMQPFMYTLAMEYSLLASALLLHLWREIATPNAGEYGQTSRKKWQIWRFGFVAGLFSLPLCGMTAVNATVEFNERKVTILYSSQLILFVLLFSAGVYGLRLLKSSYAGGESVMKVDIILLCVSWLGFLIIDLFTIFATCGEIFKNFNAAELVIGLASIAELIATGVLKGFIVCAYSRRMPLNPRDFVAAKKIRQIGSFCLTVSFGLWAMKTYVFRSKHKFDFVGSRYFQDVTWFVVTQVSVPFCTFFHFHSAVCLAEVIAIATP